MTQVRMIALLAILATPVAAQQIPLEAQLQNDAGSQPYRDAIRRYLNREAPKIIGGEIAPVGAYPWQVSISVSRITDPVYAHFCAGTIYANSWIVTAAHCVENNSPDDLVIIAGTNKLGIGGARRPVSRILVNSSFDLQSKANDIALLQLEQPLVLGVNIRSIPIVPANVEDSVMKPTTKLTVVGWGAISEGGKVVRNLRYVEVPFVERAQCNRPFAYDGRVTDEMICAGDRNGRIRDSCQGDSGGSLTVATSTNPMLAGIVSWGDGCGQPNKVGIYVRAAKYTAWVASCTARPEACH